jgi:hypothetical protein
MQKTVQLVVVEAVFVMARAVEVHLLWATTAEDLEIMTQTTVRLAEAEVWAALEETPPAALALKVERQEMAYTLHSLARRLDTQVEAAAEHLRLRRSRHLRLAEEAAQMVLLLRLLLVRQTEAEAAEAQVPRTWVLEQVLLVVQV